MKEIEYIFKVVLDGVKSLDNLEAKGIWIFFTVVLVGIVIYDKREASRKFDVDKTISAQRSVAEAKTAEALSKLAESYQRLSDVTKTAIDIALRRP